MVLAYSGSVSITLHYVLSVQVKAHDVKCDVTGCKAIKKVGITDFLSKGSDGQHNILLLC